MLHVFKNANPYKSPPPRLFASAIFFVAILCLISNGAVFRAYAGDSLAVVVHPFPFAQTEQATWYVAKQGFDATLTQSHARTQPVAGVGKVKTSKSAVHARKALKHKKPTLWQRLFHRHKKAVPPKSATASGVTPKGLSSGLAAASLAVVPLTSVTFPTYWKESSMPPTPDALTLQVMRFVQQTNPRYTPVLAQVLATCIVQAGEAYEVDPLLVASLIATESSFRPEAVSSTGAKGLGQLKDDTAAWLGVSNPFDVEQNVYATAKYLSILGKKFPESPAEAVASYYVGQGTVQRQGLSDDAIRYVQKVQGYLLQLMALGKAS
jgi:hypothetical protein